MQTIRIQRQIESETLNLPELRPLAGRVVEITIREQEPQVANVDRWRPLIDAAGKDLIDPDAYKTYREFDRERNAPSRT